MQSLCVQVLLASAINRHQHPVIQKAGCTPIVKSTIQVLKLVGTSQKETSEQIRFQPFVSKRDVLAKIFEP